MPVSDAQLKAIAKYDKENYQHISFKVRIGARDRIKEAAEATNQSINGFIKNAISKAMMEAINKPLEPTDDEAATIILLRILSEELDKLTPWEIGRSDIKKIRSHLIDVYETVPVHSEPFVSILSSDLSSKDKKKALRKLEDKKHKELKDTLIDFLNDPDFEI